jgi:NADH-quinone oxidoreductase subunit M
MILVWIILLPLLGGLLAWLVSRWCATGARWTALAFAVANLVLALVIWAQHYGQAQFGGQGPWLVEFQHSWIPQLGVSFYLAIDGLSLLLVLLTALLGVMAVAASWRSIQQRVGFFHFNLLWALAGIYGVFLSLDLFLFYFAWEVMLVPLYFLIGLWGHEARARAALKFFIFTQASGLLMLLAILGLFFIHGQATHDYTFDYHKLLGTEMTPLAAMVLMLGFFVAFAVKLPVVPLHTWLPDAHTEAPTAGSVFLAGLVLKVGAYGLMRFAFPLFPQAAFAFAPVARVLAVIGILYGAVMAFAQTDLKRLVAYTSISHMGFVLLGIFAWNELALQGAVIIILAHGVSTGALFILVGALQDRLHTRDLDRLGGLWAVVPRLSGVTLFFALASLGLPGLAGFVGEFLVLLGAWQTAPVLATMATLGLILSAIYALWMIQRVFHGKLCQAGEIPDLSAREAAILVPMMAIVVWLGLYPQPVLDTAKPALEAVMQSVGPAPGHDHGLQAVRATQQPQFTALDHEGEP